MTVALVPGSVPIATLANLYWNDLPSWLHASAKPAVEQAAAIVAKASEGGAAVYGLLKATMGLRLTAEEEFEGADLSIHRIGATPDREASW